MSNPQLSLDTFVDQAFGENAFVVHATGDDGNEVGWIIDPSFPPQVDQLLAYVRDRAIIVEKIILTHGHADHVAGLDVAHAAHPDASILLAEPDQPMLADGQKNLSAPFGLNLTLESRATDDLTPGTELRLGPFRWEVLDTSGHSPGGRSLYCRDASIVIAGDALFAGSIGRTDFPGSDHDRLIANIRNHLLSLPGETRVHSGHGPTTTIEIERKSNPFLSERKG